MSTPPQVYELLRDRIRSSHLAPDTAFKERALPDGLGVSRTPICEAIRRKAGEDLITVTPNAGTRVAPVDPARDIECCILRITLEMVAYAKAAPAFTDADGLRLKALITRKELAITADDTMQKMALDIEFHRQIVQLGGYGVGE